MGIGIHIIGLVLERPIRKLRAALLPEAVERALRGADADRRSVAASTPSNVDAAEASSFARSANTPEPTR
jgi:hypothetical protein